jgi:HEAT repeat protein
MAGLFRRLFNIYPGEEKHAALFACLAFIWALGVSCGTKFSDALFLIHVGAESLPTAYTLTACSLILGSSFLLYAYHRYSPYQVFSTIVSVAILFYASISACLYFDLKIESQALWFTLRVFAYLMFSVVITSYWLFVDQYYHLQDAKRLYTLFNTVVFFGFASTGLIMQTGLLNLTQLILMILFFFTLTLIVMSYIARKVVPVADDTASEVSIMHDQPSIKQIGRSVFASKFTVLLMASNFLMYVLIVINEFNYWSAFDHAFDTAAHVASGEQGTDASLTLFLGKLITAVGATNLFFGLFIYSRLVRRFGVTSLVIVTPLLLLLVFSGQLFSDSLLFPIMGYFVSEGTFYVIDDSNFNLLLNAVPGKVKYKIRIIIESFFEPLGMLVSALILSWEPMDSRLLGFILAGCWLILILGVRSNYLQALFSNLSDSAIHFQRTAQQWLQHMKFKERKTAENKLLSILKHDDPSSQLFAIDGLLSFEDITVLKKMMQLADHMQVATKIKFLDLIGQSPFDTEGVVLDHLHHWILDENDIRLTSAIYFYLAKRGLLHPEKVSNDLRNPDLIMQGAAILALKQSSAAQSLPALTINRTMALQHLHELLNSEDEDKICMALTLLGVEPLTQNVDLLVPYLKNPSPQIARTAAQSIAQIIDEESFRSAPLLISMLNTSNDSEFRIACLKALGKIIDSTLVRDILTASAHFRPNERRLTEQIIIKMGLRTVPVLLAVTKDTTLPDRCRTLAGRTLGILALPQLHANLGEIVHNEIERAYFYFYHHHTIQARYPEVDLSALKDALLTGYHSVMDFIIQILGVAGSVEDAELLSRSLRSPNLKVRGQVLETLEKTCDTKIFLMLQPLVSEQPLEEKLRSYIRSGYKPLTLTELLDRMAESPSQADQIMSAALKYRLNVPNWRESLRKQMASNEELFHHFAFELLEA